MHNHDMSEMQSYKNSDANKKPQVEPLEPWLRGPLAGFSSFTMPAAHALTQSRENLEAHVSVLTTAQVWSEPGGAPSVGFHLRHIAGSIDRLLSYTLGRSLTVEQFRFLAAERNPGEPPAAAEPLISAAQSKIDEVLQLIRSTPDERLFEPRTVGRAQLPSSVFGLLFHIAEHTQRHTGQIIATARIVRGITSSIQSEDWER
ncbi:MAG: DinB family protein [Blastocatellia bacterium]|nr:DinB family protein [Blastocatellia bacterium]